MIAFLSGQLQAKSLRSLIVLVGGVGYRVAMSLGDLSCLGPEGSSVVLHVHTHVREDAIELYGFLSEEGLLCFEKLISVSGIGPKMALSLLSNGDPARLTQVIASGDIASLTRLPGIGSKMAQRLVLELKDKMEPVASSLSMDLRSAILNLGYKPQQAEQAIQRVESLIHAQKPLPELVREALRGIQ
ncbi:MAG: Holliday junction branch migration protein RuvA [Myxococcaceae bacterium]|nr:Holliday junction branch migration protein RuvA [Myxococcaceae bacterium]MBH2005791.1 Holliday junction branch migration protein RuvA [Myxococcaceae bacterium]